MAKEPSILRPEELPFFVPPILANSINELISAIEDERWLDMIDWKNEVEGDARCLPENLDMAVRRYYVDSGWEKGRIPPEFVDDAR